MKGSYPIPMTGPIIQCPINFSEGRRSEVIEAIAETIRRVPGAVLADYSADVDHNRMVATILGGPSAIRQAILDAACVAVENIDLRQHSGVHPRIGAVDVVPLVPIRDITMEECVMLSYSIGRELAGQFGLPVYLYERSARPGHPSSLPQIRAGEFEELAKGPLIGERTPDFGPQQVHPSAGAVVVGAREPLIAYNIDLATPKLAVAQRIAAVIRRERQSRSELTGVRALGLILPSRGRAQVSMNLTRPDLTPIPFVFDFVRKEAERNTTKVYRSEVIGLIPRCALVGKPPECILWRDFRKTQLLDYWLEAET